MLEQLFLVATEMESMDDQGTCSTMLNCKIMATLFYEPSTRTRFSFEAAMLKLGGQVITTENATQFSSVAKGETLEDTIRIVNGYADVIVLRHSDNNAPEIAAKVSEVPVINAGAGTGEHPTQALLDMLTIHKELKQIDGLHVGMVGDIKYSRVIRSLIKFLGLYKNIKMDFCSPLELSLTDEDRAYLQEKKIPYAEHASVDSFIASVDVLYVTRVQKERFASQDEYERLKNAYVIDKNTIKKMKQEAIIMHALPRITEIASEVDSDPRAAYFRQAQNGLYIRMALLKMLLT